MAIHGPVRSVPANEHTRVGTVVRDRNGKLVDSKQIEVVLNRIGAAVGGSGAYDIFTGISDLPDPEGGDRAQPAPRQPQADWRQLADESHPLGPTWEANSPCGLRTVVSHHHVAGGRVWGFYLWLGVDDIASGFHRLWSPDDAKLAAEDAVTLALRNLDLCRG